MSTELFCFLIVGASAFLVHFGVVTLWLVPGGMAPLWANVLAFLIAFMVSYFGHRHLTFRAGHVMHMRALPRFFFVSCLGFVINEALYFILLNFTMLDYRVALFIVLAAVATLTFALGKLWAFAGNK